MKAGRRLRELRWKLAWKTTEALRRRGIDRRIPIAVPSAFVTGSVGKTTTCRMLSWILMRAGTTVALATTQGAYVDGDALREGDSAGCKQASRLLLDPRTEAVVFELARGGLDQPLLLGELVVQQQGVLPIEDSGHGATPAP